MRRSTSAWIALLCVLAVGASGCKRKEIPAPVNNTAATVPATPVATVATTPDPVKVEPAALAVPVASVAKPAAAPYVAGSKIKINWKGSAYPGVITKVVGKDQYKIHYDGYGNEWDEVIGPSRIVGRR